MIPVFGNGAEESGGGASAAASAADLILAACLEAVRFGTTSAAIVEEGRLAGVRMGARDLDIQVASGSEAGPTDGRAGTASGGPADRWKVEAQPSRTLAKASLVTIGVRGRLNGSWFGLARTTIVGYDTLPEQLRLARTALVELVRCCENARAKSTVVEVAQSIPAVRRDGVDRCQVVLLDASRSGGGLALQDNSMLELDQIIYVEVTASGGRDAVRLGDMVRVRETEGQPLTRLARRLWL